MMKNDKLKDFKVALKDKNLKQALVLVSDGLELDQSQILKLFELTEYHNIFDIMNDLIVDGKTIPDKYLILASFYLKDSFADHLKSVSKEDSTKPTDLRDLYFKKSYNTDYRREIFVEWRYLFDEMIADRTVYKTRKTKSNFYMWPHEYEKYIIQENATTQDSMFSQASADEILDIVMNCEYYPEMPGNRHRNKIDEDWHRRNSRYHDLQRFASWLSLKIEPIPVVSKDVQMVEQTAKMSKVLPSISKGVIAEIDLYYQELVRNDMLEIGDKELVKKLYHQRLNELLSDYKDVTNKERTKLKNGTEKNADDFLYESLLEIREIFNGFTDKVLVKSVENLSLNIRVTKEFIKHSF